MKKEPSWKPNLIGFALSCVGLGVISLSVSFFLFHARRVHACQVSYAAQHKLVRPFSAALTHSYYLPSGELSRVVAIDYLRYSDRTTVNRPTLRYPTTRELPWEVSDLATEVRLLLEPRTKSVTTTRYTRDEEYSFFSGAWEESCPAESEISSSSPGGVYFGYQTLHVSKTWSPQWIQERWMIPELECFSVKEINTVPGGAHNELIAASLTEGEPSRDLARPPSGYIERSPISVEQAYKEQTGDATFWGKGLTQRLQHDYEQRRVQ